MSACTGHIIEFLDSGKPKFGLVLRQAGRKLQLVDNNGRTRRIGERELLVIHAETPAQADFMPAAAALDARIAAKVEEVDTELLWESCDEVGEALDLAGLSDSYFGAEDPAHQSAVARALLDDPIRFRCKHAAFYANDADEMASRQHAATAARERQALTEAALAAIKGWRQAGRPNAVHPAEAETPVVDKLKDYLLRSIDNETPGWLRKVAPKQPPRELAYQLLETIGELPPDADRFTTVAGLSTRFSERAEALVEALPEYRDDPRREDLSGTVCFSIDDEETVEVDDALSVEPLDDGIRVHIHIADVACFTTQDDVLDQEAAKRVCSVYLPHCRVTMLPERLSCHLASLEAGARRPAMSFVADLGADGELRDWRLSAAEISVTHRLSYTSADQMLAASATDAVSTALHRLDAVARALEARRQAHGAVTLRRPELKLSVNGDRVSVKLVNPYGASGRIVSEMMILANSLAATFAAEHEVPVIYRVQDAPDQVVPKMPIYEPVTADRIGRCLKRGRLSLHPRPHAGLGLEAYTQTTSPIRRYGDLVLQRQLHAQLSGEALPYSRETLMEILGAAQEAESANRRLERAARRYYTLRALQQWPEEPVFEAVALNRTAGGCVVELVPWAIRGRLAASAVPKRGTPLSVTTAVIEAEQDILDFREV